MAMRVDHSFEPSQEHLLADGAGQRVNARQTRVVTGRMAAADARMRIAVPSERSFEVAAEPGAQASETASPMPVAPSAAPPGSVADYVGFWRSRAVIMQEPMEPVELLDAEAGPELADVATDAPAANVTPPALPAPPAAPAAPAEPAAAPAAGNSFSGERPVDADWLAAREAAMNELRADVEAARAQAVAGAGTGPGWVAGVPTRDESGNLLNMDPSMIAFVADDPAAQPVIIGYDEGGPVYEQTAGHWMEFSEDAFAQWYRAQNGAPLQVLAALYGSDPASLFTSHPELWQIALTDHALNAGPAPDGFAMGDAGQLAMMDLYLSDPQIRALISAYGGTPVPATGGIAREQVRIYGQQRYDELSRLSNAMTAVRGQFTQALAAAQTSGTGPGWTERPRTATYTDESGAQGTSLIYVTDESGRAQLDASGQPQAVMDRFFDADQFTAWYLQQDGLQYEAFAAFYGASHSTYTTDESGSVSVGEMAFDNPNWTVSGWGGMQHRELVAIDLNDPPDLVQDDAVGFDFEVGWATHNSNIEQDEDWFESAFQIIFVAVVAWISAGTLGPAAAGAMGLTVAGTTTLTAAGLVVSAAVAGAATSVASGMLSGDLNFKDILRGALAGGLTAGLMNGLGSAFNTAASPVGTLALRTTVQGGVQALLGGSFRDGALAGFASGLADLANANINQSIADAVKAGTMDATQAATARVFARVVGSAIRAAGNPDDPQHAFASAFLDSVLQEMNPQQPPAVTAAFDDEGNLMPGVVDPNLSLAEQQAQLRLHLESQGIDQALAASMAAEYFAGGGTWAGAAQPTGGGTSDSTERTYRELLAEALGIDVADLQDASWSDEAQRSFDVLRGLVEGAGISILSTAESLVGIVRNPREFVAGVYALLSSSEARAALGESLVTQVKVDLKMLEDAWASGDMRGVGQQVGKLSMDLAQLGTGVAGAGRAAVGLSGAAARAAGRALNAIDDLSLLRAGGVFAADGTTLMDFRALTSAQKGVVGEVMGADAVQRLVPDATRIGRVPSLGQQGIDDLFRVSRPDVDFVVVEYKFGSSQLGNTLDGLQMSDTWLRGSSTGTNRILESVGDLRTADAVDTAIRMGRVERWVVHTDPLGRVTVGMVDSGGRFIPQPVSRLIGSGK